MSARERAVGSSCAEDQLHTCTIWDLRLFVPSHAECVPNAPALIGPAHAPFRNLIRESGAPPAAGHIHIAADNESMLLKPSLNTAWWAHKRSKPRNALLHAAVGPLSVPYRHLDWCTVLHRSQFSRFKTQRHWALKSTQLHTRGADLQNGITVRQTSDR